MMCTNTSGASYCQSRDWLSMAGATHVLRDEEADDAVAGERELEMAQVGLRGESTSREAGIIKSFSHHHIQHQHTANITPAYIVGHSLRLLMTRACTKPTDKGATEITCSGEK